MLRARRLALLLAAMFLLHVLIVPPPARAQDPVQIGPYVVDVRGALPRLGQDAFVAGQRGLDPRQLPTWGLGLDLGAHVYPLRWRAITFGFGVEALFSRGESVPNLSDIELIGPTPGDDPLAPVRTKFSSISPQLSFNFGGTTGWSYLSGGIGRARYSVAPAGVEDRGERRFTMINYGGGGRWFAKDHLAFSLDLRIYTSGPVEATTELPGLPRLTLFVFSAGVAFK